MDELQKEIRQNNGCGKSFSNGYMICYCGSKLNNFGEVFYCDKCNPLTPLF